MPGIIILIYGTLVVVFIGMMYASKATETRQPKLK